VTDETAAPPPTDRLAEYRASSLRRTMTDAEGLEFDPEMAEQLFHEVAVGVAISEELFNAQPAVVRELMARAADDAAKAVTKLIDADLNSPEGIDYAKGLQNLATRYRDMVKWLSEAMNVGQNAEAQLREYDATLSPGDAAMFGIDGDESDGESAHEDSD